MKKTKLIKLNKPSVVRGFGVKDDKLIIEFEKDKIVLDSYHDQDCCEHVYADFEIALAYKKHLSEGGEIKSLSIKGVRDMGIMLVFKGDHYLADRILIPCYDEQNGYYSSKLKLIIDHNGKKSRWDISDFVEHKFE